jgi:hypothetical protein
MRLEEQVQLMSKDLIFDILNAIGLPKTEHWYKRFQPFFSKATGRLSHIGLAFDRLINEIGFPRAAEWSLTHWCRGIIARGRENVPQKGPLLVISNHPGAYDALVIAAQLHRPDLRLIASDLPFLRYLQNFSQRIFFIPLNKNDTFHRMAGMLSAVRYLKDGGAVLLMGSGTIDPDPAVYPGASSYIQRWTEAANIFLHLVPNTNILLTAVSHIVARKWAYHPLTWLRRNGLEKRRIAEFGQVLQQLFFPGSLYASPRLSFAPILTAAELGTSPRKTLVEHEISLLVEHCKEFGGFSH